jgi:hypothetical protein
MLSPVTHILPITNIRRTRLLPVAGKVVVRKGQKVNPQDVVAEANLAPEHILLEVARGLGLPTHKADAQIHCKAGDDVGEGDVLAGPVGMSRRLVRAPKPGHVVVAGGGQILLELESRPFELKAGIPGTVTELVDDRGAEIETSGALVQGVWGNGNVDYGLLSAVLRAPEDELTLDRLDVSQRGLVILGGYCADTQILSMAAEIPLRGLILASIDPLLLPLALKMRYPIIVLEGFGKIPLNSAAYKLLTTNDRRDVAVNAEAWNPLAGTRPEIVIPLPSSGYLPFPPETDVFKPGQQVRVLATSYRSKVGTLVAVRPGLMALASGIRSIAADVRFEDGESAVLPLANLEVLE